MAKFVDQLTRLTNDDWRRIFHVICLPEKYWSATITKIPEGPHKHGFLEFWKDAPNHIDSGRGLFLYGPNGTGKTSMAALIAKRAAQFGLIGYWVRHETLINECMEGTDFDGRVTCAERAALVPLLIIDEVIIRENAKFKEAHLEEVIRDRVDKKKATIITSNYDPTTVQGRTHSLASILHESVFWQMHVPGDDLRGTPKAAPKDKRKPRSSRGW